jgi:creatinine amidohydrolase
VLLQQSTWQDVETYLRQSTGIVIPIGSTEQHGPMGLIGTDAICAETIATRLGEQRGVLVGPTIALAVAQFNLAFPGTVSMRASTVMAVIEDYVRSLACQGFTRMYFLNGHGGNIAPARAAFQDLYAEHSYAGRQAPFRCLLRSWWEYPQADRLRRELYAEGEGMHATPSEIAITQYALPASARASDAPAPLHLDARFLHDHAGDNHFDADTHRQWFPDGRVGSDSAQARREHGAKLVALAIEDAWADYSTFLREGGT